MIMQNNLYPLIRSREAGKVQWILLYNFVRLATCGRAFFDARKGET